MYSLWKSYALLQHAQQLLFGLVSLGWQQQQQQMFQPAAALLRSKISGPPSQQRLCLAPSARAVGHSTANSYVIRHAAPPATVQFFTARRSDRSGTAAGLASSRESHHIPSATAAAALTGGSQTTRSVALSFGETPAFRAGSTRLPFACSRGLSVDARVWRRPITAPATAAVTLAALLLPSIGKQGTTCQQEQRQSRCQLLPCLMRNGKKGNRICSSNSGKSSGQSDPERAGKYSSRLCCCISVTSGRTTETAAPRASLVQYSLCRDAIHWTSGTNVAAGSISPSGALPSSACSSGSAATAIRKNTETADGAATASAAASGTMCRPVTGVSPAATAEEMPRKTSSFRSTAPGGGSEDAAEASAPDAGANSPCWQRFNTAPMFTQLLRMVFLQNKPLYTPQVEKLAADSAAATAFPATEETPETSAAAASETGAAPRSAAAAAVTKGLLKLAEMLPQAGVVLGTDSLATAQKTGDPFQAAGENKKWTRSSAGDAAHAEKAAAAATRAYFFYLRHLAFLEQKLQRQRFRATGKAPEGAAAVAGGGLKSCTTEEISCSGSSTRSTDAGKAEKRLFIWTGVPRSAALSERMKKTLAWISWRKEDDTDKRASPQKENGDNEAAATTRSASEGDDIFAAADEAKEVYDKGAEEARRQAFRSPVVAAVFRFWEETPKFTRFYLSTAFSLSLLSSLYGQSYPRLFSPAALLFNFSAIRQKKELHRLITSLFFFGPVSLPTLLSLSFVHAYLGGLEQHFQRLEEYSALYSSGSQRASSRRLLSLFPIMSLFSPFSPRHMFSRLLLSSAAAAMTLAALKQIPNEHLLQCISTTLLHVWSRLFPSGEADFYGLFTVSNEYLPFFFLAQNWLFEGRIVAADIYGIGVAALWLLLVQQRHDEYVDRQWRLQSREQQQDQPPT